RDVERVDKQDDRAAARLFSSETLDCLLHNFPDQRALAIYLFVLGELVDAWQNRRIGHISRIQMALRARFFLMAWQTHIEQHSNHRKDIHFISRESCAIFIRLCDSLLQLIFVHQKFFSSYPLLPWLHSTEACEHFFGMLRQLKTDFTFADAIYLEPKLRTLMLGAFRNLTAQEQANATASGYHHMYFIASDIDLKALATWPSAKDIAAASDRVRKEVEDLLSTVGIDASAIFLLFQQSPNTASLSMTKYVEDDDPMDASSTEDADRDTLAVCDVLSAISNTSTTIKVDEETELLTMALVSESVDKTLEMFVYFWKSLNVMSLITQNL
ncbi:hypothetical protein K488DRAFT_66592, partial [Vararia minispora EC-137]